MDRMITINIKPTSPDGKAAVGEYVIYIGDDGQIVQQPVSSTSDTTLYPFMKEQITMLSRQGHQRTAETYQATLRSICRFMQGTDVPLSLIDCSFMQRYEDHLKARRLKRNTISFYMRVLRAVYNKAVSSGLTEDRKPFKTVYTGIGKTTKRAISLVDLRVIHTCVCPTFALRLARDLFLFSFYTRGMSFIDMAYLKKTDVKNGMLTYKRRKTGQHLQIRWEPCMQRIVDRYEQFTDGYLLPIIRKRKGRERTQYKNKQCAINKQLKRLSRILHLDSPLSMYVARHSWATIAKEMNIPLSIISDGMGHHSLQTTQIYLATIDAEAIDAANKKIISQL